MGETHSIVWMKDVGSRWVVYNDNLVQVTTQATKVLYQVKKTRINKQEAIKELEDKIKLEVMWLLKCILKKATNKTEEIYWSL